MALIKIPLPCFVENYLGIIALDDWSTKSHDWIFSSEATPRPATLDGNVGDWLRSYGQDDRVHFEYGKGLPPYVIVHEDYAVLFKLTWL